MVYNTTPLILLDAVTGLVPHCSTRGPQMGSQCWGLLLSLCLSFLHPFMILISPVYSHTDPVIVWANKKPPSQAIIFIDTVWKYIHWCSGNGKGQSTVIPSPLFFQCAATSKDNIVKQINAIKGRRTLWHRHVFVFLWLLYPLHKE